MKINAFFTASHRADKSKIKGVSGFMYFSFIETKAEKTFCSIIDNSTNSVILRKRLPGEFFYPHTDTSNETIKRKYLPSLKAYIHRRGDEY